MGGLRQQQMTSLPQMDVMPGDTGLPGRLHPMWGLSASLLRLGGLLLFTTATSLAAEEAVVLTGNQDRYPLGRELEILEDPGKSWTIGDVTTPEIARRFVSSEEPVPNFSYTTSAWWVRLRLRNVAAPNKRWLLLYDHSNLDRIELYRPTPDRGGFEVLRTGILEPFTSRDVAHRRFVFNLPFLHAESPAAPREGTLYLRLESATPVIVPLWITSQRSLLRHDQKTQFPLGIFYGFVFILIGYHLSLVILIREWVHFLFAGSIFFLALAFTLLDGCFQLAVWPRDLPARNWFLVLTVALLVSAYLLFTQTFLQTKTYAPRLHKIFPVVIFLLLVLGGIAPWVEHRHILVGPTLFLSIAGEALAIASGVRVWARGYGPARLFCLGSSIRLSAYVFFLLTRFDVLQAATLGDLVLRVGLVGQGVFLSMALGARIHLHRAEREEAQRRLAAEQQEALGMEEELRRKLERRNVELERFYDSLSRDIKSPIITTRGFIDHLEHDIIAKDEARIRDDCARIRDSTEVLYRLVDRLVALSRLGHRSDCAR